MSDVTTDSDPTIALAIDLLEQIAEDAMLRSAYRLAARRHLRKLRAAAEGKQAA